jgi:hypothetical protein
MRNPTTVDFGTESQKFLFRLNWLFFASGAARVKLQRMALDQITKGGKKSLNHKSSPDPNLFLISGLYFKTDKYLNTK